jgi:hypothetical protein
MISKTGQSPWLDPIEPTWLHSKRKVREPDRLLRLKSGPHNTVDVSCTASRVALGRSRAGGLVSIGRSG